MEIWNASGHSGERRIRLVQLFVSSSEMSERGRSTSPRPIGDADVDMENGGASAKPHAKVVIVTNLTRNVVESHLQVVFGFYGQVTKIDLPVFGKCE